MTTYSQGFQSVWLEDIWSMEVAASSIVFHGPGADVSMSFMNPAAAELEFALVKSIWEAAKATKPYDRLEFIRQAMLVITNGITSNEPLRRAFSKREAVTGVDIQILETVYIYDAAVALADAYELSNP